jgi:hypothetical protein
MDIKDKVISIMENLDPATREEIAMMYAPIKEKDILPRVKKIFQLVTKLNEEERDQLLKLIYNDNETKEWQSSEPMTDEVQV